jgi:hypothetical protein
MDTDGSVKSGLANYPVRCGLTVASCLRFWRPSFVPYIGSGVSAVMKKKSSSTKGHFARAA